MKPKHSSSYADGICRGGNFKVGDRVQIKNSFFRDNLTCGYEKGKVYTIRDVCIVHGLPRLNKKDRSGELNPDWLEKAKS